MGSTAIQGWNECTVLTPGSVFQAPLKMSEVTSIFSVILKIDLGIGQGVVWAANGALHQITKKTLGKAKAREMWEELTI